MSAVISLVYTQTRGTYLGLLIGVGVAILILFIKRKSIVNKISRKIIIVLFGIGVLLFIGLGSIFTVYKDRDFVKQNVFLNRISTINIAIANPFLIYHSLQTENYKEMLNTIGDGTIVSRILNISIAINGLLDNPKTMLIG
ncbi:MAG: O-antigen ligase family protein [Cyanobium sp. MAG06]|nr:O-antigen ligase family protein [Cyanobium sp. MAG06]